MTVPSDPLPAELADAAEHFAHWRRTRTTRSAPTPAELRERAVALLAAHRPSTVARVLGINTVMLERWSGSPERDSTRTPSPFVSLPAPPPEPAALEPPGAPPPGDAPELALRWPGGAELVARGAIPPSALRAILEAFAPPQSEAMSGAAPR